MMDMIQIVIWMVVFIFIGRLILIVLLLRRGTHLTQTGNLKRADALYSWMQKYFKRNIILQMNHAMVDKYTEDYQSALNKYDKIISSKMGSKFFNTATYQLRGYLYLYLGRYIDALHDYRTAYELQSKQNHPVYSLYLGWGIIASYFYQKDYISTLKTTQEMLPLLENELSKIESHGAYIITSNPKSDLKLKNLYVSMNILKSLAYVYLGQVDDAKQVFNELSEKIGDFAPLYVSRAELMFVLGDYLPALQDYQQASSIFDDDNLKGLYITTSGYNFYHITLAEYAVTLFACGEIAQAQEKWRELQAKAPLLISAERAGQEFFWSDEMIAKAKELEATLI